MCVHSKLPVETLDWILSSGFFSTHLHLDCFFFPAPNGCEIGTSSLQLVFVVHVLKMFEKYPQ